LIESTDGAIFGAYIDVMPEEKGGIFHGTGDSFVFTLKPTLNKYTSVDGHTFKIALFEDSYFCIGFDGEGPAIRVDD
jgi:hypothetical protein